MDTPPMVRVLGRVTILVDGVDVTPGRRQARELLGLLVANRGRGLPTAEVVAALWDDEVPATAATIVHGHVRRLRDVLGHDAVVHDDDGYRLDVAADTVDLWMVDDAVRDGDHRRARLLWDDPPFGHFTDRPWARAAIRGMGHLSGLVDETARTARTRPISPVGRLVGRRRELDAVTRALTRSRLVSIVGMGGVGKSRLALEVATAAADVLHVDLGAAVGPAATRVAGDLGLVATGEPGWDRRTVASVIGRRDVLVVLDGCEHVADEIATVVDALLAACPALRILAVSRSSLGLTDEVVVPLLPFDAPGAIDGDAVDLLIDRLGALGVEVHGRDRRRLAVICARTAGVPLAVELAAADTVFGPADGTDPGVEARAGSRRSPTRVVTGAVRHALSGLTPPTERAVGRLARLPHGVTPDLLARLVEPGDSAPAVLYELRATGLVAAMTVGAPGRLALPDAVRAEAVDATDRAARGAVVAALRGLVDAVRSDPGLPIDAPAMTVAAAELTNIDAVLDDLVAAADPVEALGLATATAETWAEAGHWTRGGARLTGLLATVRPDDPTTPGDPPVPDGPDRIPIAPLDWARGVWARAAASATYAAVHADQADLEAAAAIAADHRAWGLEAHLVFRLALGAGYGGDTASARRWLERLHRIGAVVDNDYTRTMAAHIDALGRLVSGEPGPAAADLVSVAERLERLGATSDAARSRRMAGLAHRAAGSVDDALAELHDAEALALAAGAVGTLATIRGDIVEIRREHGRQDRGIVVDALDSVLAVGNLRAAGLLGVRLGVIDTDAARVAHATLDLLAADRTRAAVALCDLVELVPARHPLVREAPRFAAGLRAQFGSPLGRDDAERVDALIGGAAAPAAWTDTAEAHLRGMLQAIARDGSDG